MKSKILLAILLLTGGLLCFNAGCNLEGTGTLQINLTDQPADYEEVYITFSEISVHRGEEQGVTEETQDDEDEEDGEDGADAYWIVISEEEQGFNLLELQDGFFTLLAESDLEAGVYTQIRLKIVAGENESGEPKTYVKLEGDKNKYPLEVPSGTQSGLKLIHPFRVVADTTTILYLDFDAEASVKQTGAGQYKLKPTIAVLSDLSPNQGIKGIVQDAGTKAVIANAEVSAHIEGEAEGELPVGSICTDEEGNFKLPLPAGTYTLTVSAEGYDDTTTDLILVETNVWKELENPIILNPSSS